VADVGLSVIFGFIGFPIGVGLEVCVKAIGKVGNTNPTKIAEKIKIMAIRVLLAVLTPSGLLMVKRYKVCLLQQWAKRIYKKAIGALSCPENKKFIFKVGARIFE
jgi:hypothetical protein